MNLDLSLINKIVGVKNDSLNIRKGPTTTDPILINYQKGFFAGRTSGFYVVQTDGKWLEINLQEPVDHNVVGYVRDDVVTLSEPVDNAVAEQNGQKLINAYLLSELEVFKTLVRCANIILELDKKGVSTKAQKEKLKYLVFRLGMRQNDLLNSGFAQNYKTGYPKAYAGLMNGYKKIVESISGIGIIPIIVLIIVFALGVGASVACYYAFRPRYDDSKKDLKVSAELEKALSTLSPVEATKVKEDLGKQIDKAYNDGKTEGKFDGMFTFIKPLAIGLGGFWLVTKLINHQSSKGK